MIDEIYAIIVLALLVLIFLLPNFKIVKQNQVIIIERLGKFHKIIDQPGIYFTFPLIDRVIEKIDISIKEHAVTLEDQHDRALVYTYQIIDVKTFVYASLDSLFEVDHHIEFLYDQKSMTDDLLLDEANIFAVNYGLHILTIENNNK